MLLNLFSIYSHLYPSFHNFILLTINKMETVCVRRRTQCNYVWRRTQITCVRKRWQTIHVVRFLSKARSRYKNKEEEKNSNRV